MCGPSTMTMWASCRWCSCWPGCWSLSSRATAPGASDGSIWPSSPRWSGARSAGFTARLWRCCCTRCPSFGRSASPRGSSVQRWSDSDCSRRARSPRVAEPWRREARASCARRWRSSSRWLSAWRSTSASPISESCSRGSIRECRKRGPAPTSFKTPAPTTVACPPFRSTGSGRAAATWPSSGSRRLESPTDAGRRRGSNRLRRERS